MAGLFDSNSCSLWQASLAGYHEVLAHKEAGRKGKKPKTKEDSLLQLDGWYGCFFVENI
jgi:hypothetical protein